MSEWIPVTERMPDESTRVLAYLPSLRLIDVTLYHGGQFWIAEVSTDIEPVSHWMPLPEPPEVKP